MCTVRSVAFALLVGVFQGVDAFSPRFLASNRVSISGRGLALQAVVHTGIRCDCCGVDPIEGPRFSCANVPNVDICQACATLEDQSFVAGGVEFPELAWNVLVTPEDFGDTTPLPTQQATYTNEEAAVAVPAAPLPRSAGVSGTVADLPGIAAEMQGGQAVLLDVREVNEYAKNHVTFATLAPLSSLKEGIFPESRESGVGIELNKRIFVHCQSGKRAQEAAALLTKMRYSDVIALAVNYDEIAGVMPTGEGPYLAFFDAVG